MNIFFFPIIILAIAIWKPKWSIWGIILLWPTYLLRATLHGIPTTALELSIYTAAGVIFVQLVLKRLPWHWVSMTRWTWILLGLWSIAWVTSTWYSIDRIASLGALKAWFLDPLLFVALLSITITTLSDRLRVMQAMIFSACSVAVYGLYQFFVHHSSLQDGRLSSYFYPVANYAAMFIGPILILTLIGVTQQMLPRRWWAAVALLAVAQLLTLSYGGFLSVAVGALYGWWFLPNKMIRRRLFLGAVLIGVLFVTTLSQTKNFREHFNPDRSSGQVRKQIWVTSWALIQKHPLLGIGANTFQAAYKKEVPRHYYPPLEWLVAQPHNLLLALWLETGALGVVSFLALLIYHYRIVWREFLPRPEDRGIAIASLAALAVIIIHGLVDTTYFKNDLALEFLTIAILPWLGQLKKAKK